MAEPNTAESIQRGEYGHELNKYSYDATSGSPVDGWAKVDDVAGAVNPATGGGMDHFAMAERDGCPAGPWKQT